MKRICEVCGDIVRYQLTAITCGHLVFLCETCKVECPGALRLCASCELKGINPEKKR